MIQRAILIGLCLSLGGCGVLSNFTGFGTRTAGKKAVSENTLPFRAKATGVERGTDAFTVAVANQGAGVDAVRESVRFEGTKYCLFTNGSSDINWALQDGSDEWAFVQQEDSLVFSGECVGR